MMLMLTKTHTAAVKSLTDEIEEARDEIAKLKGARRIDGITVKDLEGKFKKAITDLAAAREEISALDDQGEVLRGLERDLRLADETIALRNAHIDRLKVDIASLRPDAQKWRDRAEREAARGQNRKNAKPVAAKVKQEAGK